MIDKIAIFQNEYLSGKTIAARKKLGQFYTSAVVAKFMASLISKPDTDTVRILDAGAGGGMLAAAAASRCFDLGCKKVHAVLYELDKDSADYLKDTMRCFAKMCAKNNCLFSFEIKNEDFVLARPDKNKKMTTCQLAIINPPYFKYNAKNSPYSMATADLFKGNPNIYASFMAVVLSALQTNGQMIAIIPRSFSNGLYFKGFRAYLRQVASLEWLHLFNARNKLFNDRNTEVLQENIVCKFVKRDQASSISVSASNCTADIHLSEVNCYSSDLILDCSSAQGLIRIPESLSDAKIMQIMDKFPSCFNSLGYFISTGPVVEHRACAYIINAADKCKSIPLFKAHNIKPLLAAWTGKHKKDVKFRLLHAYAKHVRNNQVYVLVKRFTSKDEHRRLVAAVYNPKAVQGNLVAFDNKINYIGIKSGRMTLAEAFGLAAVFNSTFMDKYFRCVSGSTQVNASDVRVMRFPSRSVITKIGVEIRRMKIVTQEKIDTVINRELGIATVYTEN